MSQRIYESITREFVDEVLETDTQSMEEHVYVEKLKAVLTKYELPCDEVVIREFVSATYNNVEIRIKNSNEKIATELIDRYFKQVNCKRE